MSCLLNWLPARASAGARRAAIPRLSSLLFPSSQAIDGESLPTLLSCLCSNAGLEQKPLARRARRCALPLPPAAAARCAP